MVVAEQGDGIFSLLRKQGLNPIKHYGEFIDLNSENIKDGSFLQIGVEYKVPITEDSFKKTGVLVQANNDIDKPIFDKELELMSLESERLKDAVYYLIVENETMGHNDFVRDVVQNLTTKLMVNGAKVYVMGDEVSKDSLNIWTERQRMGRYVEVINERYLQNNGKYQRVLFIRDNGAAENEDLDVAVYHYDKSEQGQRFAENIKNVFKKNSISNETYKDVNLVFEDQNNLYLAKNILPAISLLTLENASKESNDKIAVRPDKRKFAGWISSGIMNDYVDLEIEN